MKSLKKKLAKALIPVGLGSIGIVGGLKIADPMIARAVVPVRDYLSMKMDIPDVKGQINENVSQEDRDRFEQLLDIMAKTPHGRQLLRSLGKERTQLGVVDSFDEEDTLGETYGTALIYMKKDGLHSAHALWAFAHEVAHVQNNSRLAAHGATLDDEHILNIMGEALAERMGFLVFKEAKEIVPSFMTDQEYDEVLKDRGYGFLKSNGLAMAYAGGKAVFETRMFNWKQPSYEKVSQARYADWYNLRYYLAFNEYRDPRVIEKYEKEISLDENPNWDRIVRKMSGEEVRSVSSFPIPTWHFVRELILAEAKQGRKVPQMDLTCIEKNKEEFLSSHSGFNAAVLGDINNLFKYLYALDKEKALAWAKDLSGSVMPKGSVEFVCSEYFNGTWENENKLLEMMPPSDFDSFLEQKSGDYLKKAQQALKSPKLDWVKDDKKLKEKILLLRAYQHVFFEKNERSIIKNNPKAL